MVIYCWKETIRNKSFTVWYRLFYEYQNLRLSHKVLQRFGIFKWIGQLPMTIRAGAITSCLCPNDAEDDRQNAQLLIERSWSLLVRIVWWLDSNLSVWICLDLYLVNDSVLFIDTVWLAVYHLWTIQKYRQYIGYG